LKADRIAAGLAGALLAVVEETDKSDTLDEAGMKKLTGSEVITARPLFKDFVTFTATVLVRFPKRSCSPVRLSSLADVLTLLLDETLLCLLSLKDAKQNV
jgi:hypothetical protein